MIQYTATNPKAYFKIATVVSYFIPRPNYDLAFNFHHLR